MIGNGSESYPKVGDDINSAQPSGSSARESHRDE
jgi:hypothetical protein